MNRDYPSSDSVPSPCINVCVIDAVSGYCRGCLRTLDEISFWAGMTSAQKRALLEELAQRRNREDGRDYSG
jgi:predicted Fe-S protein YdhL (DUF1289 family)